MESNCNLSWAQKRLKYVNQLSKNTIVGLKLIVDDLNLELPSKPTKQKLIDLLRRHWESQNSGIYIKYTLLDYAIIIYIQ